MYYLIKIEQGFDSRNGWRNRTVEEEQSIEPQKIGENRVPDSSFLEAGDCTN